MKMNQLQVFNNEEFGQVRTVVQGEDVWFVSKDVCEILELSQPHRSIARLDEDEASIIKLKYLSNKKLTDDYIYNELLIKKDPYYVKKKNAVRLIATALGMI